MAGDRFSDPHYTRTIEEKLAKFLETFDEIPFPVVIRAFARKEVLPIRLEDPMDRELLEIVGKAALAAGKEMQRTGITSKRPNEVGNYCEPFVRDALEKVGLRAAIPVTRAGKAQTTGYPDILITDHHGRPTYLEVKTYNLENVDTTQRSFYLSPPLQKVTVDTRHLVLSYQVEARGAGAGQRFFPVHWGLYDAFSFSGQIKHEFNASNRQMYRHGKQLAEGRIV